MNSKKRLSINKTVKYLREVSVVVIGVAVTLLATHWITTRSEKRDMNLYLNAIKMELDENMRNLDGAIEYTRSNVNYARYLQTHGKESRSSDTLAYYTTKCCFIIQDFSFKKDAFEMFKSSGIMRFLNDKDLMLNLWEAYASILLVEKRLDWYSQLKWAAMEKEVPLFIDRDVEAKDLINAPVMYNFYIFDIHTSVMSNCEKALEKAKEVVGKLEKY